MQTREYITQYTVCSLQPRVYIRSIPYVAVDPGVHNIVYHILNVDSSVSHNIPPVNYSLGCTYVLYTICYCIPGCTKDSIPYTQINVDSGVHHTIYRLLTTASGVHTQSTTCYLDPGIHNIVYNIFQNVDSGVPHTIHRLLTTASGVITQYTMLLQTRVYTYITQYTHLKCRLGYTSHDIPSINYSVRCTYVGHNIFLQTRVHITQYTIC